jgi:hypothetical protein
MKTTIELAREVDPVTKLLLDKKLQQGMNHDAFMWTSRHGPSSSGGVAFIRTLTVPLSYSALAPMLQP